MTKEEIIEKIKQSDDRPSIIIDKGGRCIAAFPEGIKEETDEIEFIELNSFSLWLQEDDKAVEILKDTMPISDIISVYSSKELFTTVENIYKIQQSKKKADRYKKAFDKTKSIELYLLATEID